MDSDKLRFNSKVIHSGQFDDESLSINVPIYQTSTFAFKNARHGAECFSGESDGYIYTRIGNPTIGALEKCISDLEGGFGGIATASGMGAISTLYMALLGQGSHIVCSEVVYGPARTILEGLFSRFGVESSFVNTSDLDAIRRAIGSNSRVLYIETPANPTMSLTDIRASARIAAENGMVTIVDNTFCSPYLQQPLELGADIVVHSLTKFLNGHADIVGGMIVTKDKSLYDQIRPVMVSMGPNMDPHQAFLVLRGVKTLAVRIDRAQENALKIATYLENHDKVQWVKYPGLPSHPQYELGKRQMRGFGSMISFGLVGGYSAGEALMNNVSLATLAVSLGGVETLIQHPASMTHAKMSAASKQTAGISDDLVRYSVGIEDVNDLIDDLGNALSRI